jgi:formylglycine-generating enzyme required for sulfatase activity
MRWLALLLLGLVLLAPGCKNRDSWVVSIETDLLAPNFVDRAYVEVLDQNGQLACDDCTHQFGPLTTADFPLTFGIVKTAATVRVRVRLYRSVVAGPDGRPTGTGLVDVVGVLPPLPEGAVGARTAIFPAASFCFGRPPDLGAHTSCSPLFTGEPGPEPVLTLLDGSSGLLVSGTFGAAKPCVNPPPEGMVCVGGGAFLIGDPRVGFASDYPAQPERARQFLAPIALDRDEMTVGAVRKLIAQGKIRGGSGLTRRGAAGSDAELCTFLDDGSTDALPINCITRDLAQSVCLALDRQLPTESEWEFAAGNAVEETHYPWGEPDGNDALYETTAAICARAVVGRGRSGIDGESTACGGAPGPTAGGGAGDVTRIGLRNMGGNLSEWIDGEHALYTEPCWSDALTGDLSSGCLTASTALTNPEPRVPYRGASWARPPEASAGASRFAAPSGAASPTIGFRCAWHDAISF